MNTFNVLRNLWSLINKKGKTQILLLIAVMLFSGCSEMFLLIAAIPYLTAITQPDEAWNMPIIKKLVSVVEINSNSELISFLSIIFAAIVIIASSIQLFNIWLNRQLAAKIGSELSVKTLRKILNQPYEFHIRKNSSSVIASISKYIDDTVSMLRLSLEFFTQAIISSFLLITLIYLDGVIALTAGSIFGLTYYFLTIKTKNKLLRNSESIANAKSSQIKALQESIGGIREVIINGSQKLHLEIFKSVDYPMRYKEAQNSFIAASPKYIIEAIGLTLICILCFLITQKGIPQKEIIPILGTIALASQRLLPALQRMYSNWAQINSINSEVKRVIEIIRSKNELIQSISSEESIEFEKDIVLKDLDFRYEKRGDLILKNINLKINAGEKIGIIGETGSGKSTLLDIISGLLIPTMGNIIIDGKHELFCNGSNIETLQLWRKLISYVPQNIYLSDNSFADNIAISDKKSLKNMKNIIDASKQAKIHEFISKTIKGYDTKVGERGVKISGGQRQRIGIARALYKKCKLLILDEATSALDKKTESVVMDSMNNLNKKLTIIIVSHRLNSLKNCDRIFEVKNNNVIEINRLD